MKKIALMTLALVGALASCGISSIDDVNAPRTDWYLSERVTYEGGAESLSANTFVICDNRPTNVEVTVNTSPDVQKVELLARGLKENEVQSLVTFIPNASGSTKVSYTFKQGMAPLGIVVNPVIKPQPVKNVNVIGFTNMGVRTLGANGMVLSEPDFSQFVFPVVDSCTSL